jgi:hypothetical protein
MPSARLALTPEQRAELERRSITPRACGRRASGRVILVRADGDSYAG